jgi:hypothetical protein
MKSIFNKIWETLSVLGQAKAAAHFARMGDYESAKAVYKN